MQLTLLVPELIWPEPDDRETLDQLACPALATLLARSRLTRRPPQSLEATLADAFGQPEGAPYAAFRLLGETNAPIEAGQTCWISADPVHLRFHQEQVVLADSGSFEIELEEAHALADELNRQLSDTARFHVAAADRWYLQLVDSTLLDGFYNPPLSTVAGRRIERLMPETTQARRLRTLHTEAQMLLYAHPVNQQRENAGRMAINSLWLWGAGTLPARRECVFDGVWSLNPLARGLARAAGVPTHPLPRDAAALFEHAAADTTHLIVLEDLRVPVHYENAASYRAALVDMEVRWFAPLRAALASGRITQLTIEASTAYAALNWQCKRADLWKLWRRPQPLARVALDLARSKA